MLTKGDKIAFIIIGLLCLFVFIFWKDLKTAVGQQPKAEKVKKKDKKGKQNQELTDPALKVIQKWEMPVELKEISGLATIDETYLACVQDELGTIFIFNTSTGKIQKDIHFAAAGDYEGISVVGSTAWIIRSDGRLYEVQGYDIAKPVVIEHSTSLTAKHNAEGLCYDAKNNRLLIAIKGKEQNSDAYKGIYAFDLVTKKMDVEPAYKIDLTHQIWEKVKGKNKMLPSALDVHPATGDIYVLDGPGSRLLIMSANGENKKLYQLNPVEFPQPEGMTFTASAQLYVSNEGGSGRGNILKFAVDETK